MMNARAAVPPTAMPAIAPVESTDEELAGGGEVEVVLEVGLGLIVLAVVDTARVGVRMALLAVLVKYIGRSRFAHVAGAVTVAAPTEFPPTFEMISSGTT